jgi:predicted kinase
MRSVTVRGILVVTGPPCAGKSSVARLLAADSSRGDTVLVEVDSLFSALLPGSDRNRDDRMLAYDAAHAAARAVRERGRTPILECTYARLEQRASLLAAIADIPEAPLWVVELEVTPGEAVERFRRRDQSTDLDERLVRQRVAAFPYSEHAFRIRSGSAPPAELARQVTTWWGTQPSPVDREAWATAGIGWE